MNKILYLDATAGISGDMTVAALLDLGVPIDHLRQELAKLGLPEDLYVLSEEQVQRRGVPARYFVVQLPMLEHQHQHHAEHLHHHHRRYADIRAMLASSSLSERTKQLAQDIFLKLAEAEAVAHQVMLDEVQFHEVGAVDSIVDIVGTAIGLDWLGVDQLYVSAVPLGSGFVETAHGRLPIPAPATALLLKGLAVHGQCGAGERVTPTGAAILAALAQPLKTMPAMSVEQLGHGAGSKDFDDCPNILRVFAGYLDGSVASETVCEISCNLDDVTPEVLGYTMERLLAAGALDVWHTAIQMKKQRPAVLLSLLCRVEQQANLTACLMEQTGSLGVRLQTVQRLVQERLIEERQTCYGPVRFKVSSYGNKPEYEDCCRIAREQGLPLREVQRRIIGADNDGV